VNPKVTTRFELRKQLDKARIELQLSHDKINVLRKALTQAETPEGIAREELYKKDKKNAAARKRRRVISDKKKAEREVSEWWIRRMARHYAKEHRKEMAEIERLSRQ